MSETTGGERQELNTGRLHDQQQANEAYQCFRELFPRQLGEKPAIKSLTIANEPYCIDLYQQAFEDRGVFLVSAWWNDSGSEVPVRTETVFAIEAGLNDIKLSSFMFSDVTGPRHTIERHALDEDQFAMPPYERAMKMGKLENEIRHHAYRKGQDVIDLLGQDEDDTASYEDAKALVGLLNYVKSVAGQSRYTG